MYSERYNSPEVFGGTSDQTETSHLLKIARPLFKSLDAKPTDHFILLFNETYIFTIRKLFI